MNNNDTIVSVYLAKLKEHLPDYDVEDLSYATGAPENELTQLKEKFPDCPASLIELLSTINGTYWQQYGEHEVNVLILGSDVEHYPYYLKSVRQILEENNHADSINSIYSAYLYELPDLIDERIDANVTINRWLCFSDCMNNGGTSRLYIDFNPTSKGKKGQIVRFLHDPDSYKVIADSFDDYLQMLIDGNFDFLQGDEE